MANKKIQIIPPDGGYVDVLHPETTASQVIEETNKKFLTDAERVRIAAAITTAPTKSSIGLANVDNLKQMPITGGILENYTEKITTLNSSIVELDLRLSNIFISNSTSTNRTVTFYGLPSSGVPSVTLIMKTSADVYPITFESSIKWQNGVIPDLLKANMTFIFTFITTDNGVSWLGIFGGEF